MNGTSVTLEWGPPLDKGGRSDITYNVLCRRCGGDVGQCEACGSGTRFVPQQMSLAQGALTVTNLLAHTNYSFWVEAVNGVSDLSLEARRAAVANITTNQAGRRSRRPPENAWSLTGTQSGAGVSQVVPAAFCPLPKGPAAGPALLAAHTSASPRQVTTTLVGKSLSHAHFTFANPLLRNALSPGNSAQQSSPAGPGRCFRVPWAPPQSRAQLSPSHGLWERGQGRDRPLLLTLPVGNQPSAPSRDAEPPSREEIGANEANTSPYIIPFSHPSQHSALHGFN